ncbi:choice-of-anchor K domain-containing protein [Streptomyces sp. NPDC016845]|uniref:choice-of-anchor K domain-containing protein n=1 Tax=Streptomyces sp. NPDC016845 TaxID=3364972 RepID=UPI0037A283E0
MGIIRTTGKWTAVLPEPRNVTGVGSSKVQWGTATSGEGRSGYTLTGGATQAQLNGNEFTLASFKHENFPINSGISDREWDVTLQVNVTFEDHTSRDFTFKFHHNETDNNGPHPDDIVSLPEFISPETVTVDGQPYKVMLSGFKQGGQVVRRFDSPEGGSNSADIVAVFAKPGKPDVTIVHVEAEGSGPGQPDEYAEIFNKGTEAAGLGGWKLRARNSGKEFTFPAGTKLAPGTRVRVYTNEQHQETGGFSFASTAPVWDDRTDVALLTDGQGKETARLRYGQKITPDPVPPEVHGPGEAHPHVIIASNDSRPVGKQKVVLTLSPNGPLRFSPDHKSISAWSNAKNKMVEYAGTLSADKRTLTIDADLELPADGQPRQYQVQVAVDGGAPSGSYTLHWELGELGSVDSVINVK